jgi:hypothetical protein
MHDRVLTVDDIYTYCNDALKCYQDNHLIFDSQNPLLINDFDSMYEFLHGYVTAPDSMVVGIFDEHEDFLYGLVIFDNMRCVDKFVAEVHIAISKEIWGNPIKEVFNKMMTTILFDVIYCTIPQIAVRAIGMVRRMGFKKTGYIPCALPYKNSKGEEKLYDLNIFTYRKDV